MSLSSARVRMELLHRQAHGVDSKDHTISELAKNDAGPIRSETCGLPTARVRRCRVRSDEAVQAPSAEGERAGRVHDTRLRVPPGRSACASPPRRCGPCVAASCRTAGSRPVPAARRARHRGRRPQRDLTPTQLCTLLGGRGAAPAHVDHAARAVGERRGGRRGRHARRPRVRLDAAARELLGARAPPPPSSRESRHGVVQLQRRARRRAGRWTRPTRAAAAALAVHRARGLGARGGQAALGWLSKLATRSRGRRRYFVAPATTCATMSDAPDAALAGAIDLRDVIARAPGPLAGTDERPHGVRAAAGGCRRRRGACGAGLGRARRGSTGPHAPAHRRRSARLGQQSLKPGSLLPPPPPRTARPRLPGGRLLRPCAAKVGLASAAARRRPARLRADHPVVKDAAPK